MGVSASPTPAPILTAFSVLERRPKLFMLTEVKGGPLRPGEGAMAERRKGGAEWIG